MRRQLALMAVWAGGAFGLALALGLPATSNAVDDANSPAQVATISTPRLTVNGVELTAAPDAPATRPAQTAGDSADRKFKFGVRAENKTNSAASGEFIVRLTSVAPTRPQARTLPVPIEVWKDSTIFALKPGEVRTYTLTTPPLTAARVFTVTLGSSSDHVTMYSMAGRNP